MWLVSIVMRVWSLAWPAQVSRGTFFFRPRLLVLEARIVLTDYYWTGSMSGDWLTKQNWLVKQAAGFVAAAATPGTDPTNDVVFLDPSRIAPKGTDKITLSAARTVSSLRVLPMFNGQLILNANLRVSNTFQLLGGTIGGDKNLILGKDKVVGNTVLDASGEWQAGRMEGKGKTIISNNVSFRMTTGAQHVLSGRTLLNRGTVSAEGGSLNLVSGGTFKNAPGGTFNFALGFIASSDGAGGKFVNDGTFVARNVGVSRFGAPFDNENDGKVIYSGLFVFTGGGKIGW